MEWRFNAASSSELHPFCLPDELRQIESLSRSMTAAHQSLVRIQNIPDGRHEKHFIESAIPPIGKTFVTARRGFFAAMIKMAITHRRYRIKYLRCLADKQINIYLRHGEGHFEFIRSCKSCEIRHIKKKKKLFLSVAAWFMLVMPPCLCVCASWKWRSSDWLPK